MIRNNNIRESWGRIYCRLADSVVRRSRKTLRETLMPLVEPIADAVEA